MSRFFIHRPIVAMVIAILTVIVGAITILGLPISQFRQISFSPQGPETKLRVHLRRRGCGDPAEYPVVTPIEEQTRERQRRVDNMNYM